MDIDLEELAAMVQILKEADFSEFRYEKGDLRIVVRRGPAFPDAEETSTTTPPAKRTEPAPRLASARTAEAPAVLTPRARGQCFP